MSTRDLMQTPLKILSIWAKKSLVYLKTGKIRPISATVNMESVHPGEQLGFDSDPYLLEVARNTVDVCGNDGYSYGSAGWNMVNNTPKIFTHAARVRYDAATLISKIKQFVVNKMAGNYYVKDNTHGWEKSGRFGGAQ